jgi:dolichyl-phosphate-mannose--protein O-mannosyl transferase
MSWEPEAETDVDVQTEADAEDGSSAVRPTRVERFARERWYARPFVVIAAVTALAGALRFYHLSFPHSYVFDEVYYAKDGCYDAGFPFRQCHLDAPGEQTITVHPPLGRWIIAGGEALYGNRSYGWRVASALFGTLSVLLLSILAYRLFGSAVWAGAAGLLLATENLNFVQSRISMLDIFVTTFVVAGFLFLVLDRQWMERRTPRAESPSEDDELALFNLPPDRPPSPILRPWRIAAGLAFGAASATKWSGGAALLGAVILTVMWERTRRKRIGLPHPLRETLRDESFGIFAFLFILPAMVYLASYARYFADNHLDFGAWWTLTKGMANYSIHLHATHPYASRPWWWVLLKRPVAYYYMCVQTKGSTCVRNAEILGIGNPVVFWATVFTIPYLVVAWIRKLDWRPGFVIVAFASQYFPWFLIGRTSFLFYMAPITPFMVLGLTYSLRDVSEVRLGAGRIRALAPVAAFGVLACVGVFAFFLPVLTGKTIAYHAWQQRMWLGKCSPKPTWCWV